MIHRVRAGDATRSRYLAAGYFFCRRFDVILPAPVSFRDPCRVELTGVQMTLLHKDLA